MLRGIPGDKVLPIIGTAWTYFPYIGTGDHPERLHEAYLRKYLKYGEIFGEQMGGKTFVSVFNPKDIEIVHRSEGKYPSRISHDIQLFYRRQNPHLYASGGLTPTNGEEWYKLRRSFQVEIRMPTTIARHIPAIQDTTTEFVKYLDQLRKTTKDGLVTDVLKHLHHWALETACLIVLDKRVDKFGFNRDPMCYKLIAAGWDLLHAIRDGEYSRMYQYFENKAYREVQRNEGFLYNFVRDNVDKTLRGLATSKPPERVYEPSLLFKYLCNHSIDIRDVISTSSDFLLAGLLTPAIAASYVLHTLGKYPAEQERLFQEILPFMKEPYSGIDVQACKVDYLKACVKEALRLNPTTLGTGRVLAQDATLAGRIVPKGMIVLTQTQVAGKLPQYIARPIDFFPDRWIRERNEKGVRAPPNVHPFLVNPFGIGFRSCIGQSFAELELFTFVASVIRKFKVVTVSDDIKMKTIMLNVPTNSIDIKFIPRDEEPPASE